METVLIAVVVLVYEVDTAIHRNRTMTSRGDPIGLCWVTSGTASGHSSFCFYDRYR